MNFPSRFAVGNAALATFMFLILGTPFYLINTLTLIAYSCGAIALPSAWALHRYRAVRHTLLKPHSIINILTDIRLHQDHIESRLDVIELQLSITKTEGGDCK